MHSKSTLSLLLVFLCLCCTACPSVKKFPLPGEEIPLIDAQGLTEFIQQHQGKVILIDFWATWCRPCVELFPHTVELHERWAQRGLVVVGISLDDPADGITVWQFLEEKKATFPNFISRFGPSAKSASDFEIQGGGIPYLRLYDRQGKPLKSFGGNMPVYLQEIDQAVEDALDQI